MSSIHNDNVEFRGTGLSIYGDRCHGSGARCKLYGDRIDITEADGATVYGDDCTVWCEDASTITIYGKRTRVNGAVVSTKPRDRERDRGPAAAPVVDIVDEDDTSSNITVLRGVSHMSGSGGTVRFDGSGMHISGGAHVRVVASSASRPPPSRVPRNHTCAPAADGEAACAICMENRVDAVLQPCGHANLCVDCAAKLYRTKSTCPTCRAAIESVVAAFFGGVVDK